MENTEKINELNAKANEIAGYLSNDIRSWFNELTNKQTVIVGYRASCGSTDKTMKVYKLWIKAIKLLEKSGVKIMQENINVENRNPTSSGGFWNEVKFTKIK
jgi:hypothetical protein